MFYLGRQLNSTPCIVPNQAKLNEKQITDRIGKVADNLSSTEPRDKAAHKPFLGQIRFCERLETFRLYVSG